MMNFAQIGIFSRTQFTPLSLPGIAAWYDADDANTITLSTGVSQWRDKSGNVRHAVQATGSKQPTLSVAALNGKNALQFDGVDDDLVLGVLADWTFLHSTASTVYIVTKIGDTADPGSLYSLIGNSAGSSSAIGYLLAFDDRVSVPNNNAIILQAYKGTSGTSTHAHTAQGLFTPNSWGILSAIARVDGTNASALAVNKNPQSSDGNFSAPSLSNPTYTLKLGQHGNNGGFLKGYVAEVIIYNQQHTVTDRERVINYLNQKWAIF